MVVWAERDILYTDRVEIKNKFFGLSIAMKDMNFDDLHHIMN